MNWSLSTYLLRSASLGARQLDQIAEAGFAAVEIYGDRGHFDYTNPGQVREIAQWANSSQTKISALHAPLSRDSRGTSPHSMISIALLDRQRRQDSMDEIKRALETAEHMPIPYLIVHLGVDGEEHDLRKFDAALTSLEHLCLFAGQRGVRLLLENIPNDLSSPRRLKEFFAHTHLRGVDICLDTGHAHLEGGVAKAVEILGARIAAVHMSDNQGVIDDHLMPGAGKIDWSEALLALREQSPQAIPTIEARAQAPGPGPMEQARECRERLQRMWNGD